MAELDCIFCKIVAGEIPGEIVLRDGLVTAFRDVNPQAPTHILIVPNVHIATLADLTDADLSQRLLRAATRIAGDEGLDGGYRIVTNTGPDGGQSVAHVHWHLLGGRKLGRLG